MNGTPLSDLFQSGGSLSTGRQLRFVWALSIPAILAQISSIIMQYIDAAMVGRLGANASAAIGVVSTSMWLIYGLGSAASAGFSVQVAQKVGAGEIAQAQQVVREGVLCITLFSVAVGLTAAVISPFLPVWLKADESLWLDASSYFLVFALSQPLVMLTTVSGLMLECSGNMKLPSILNTLLCVLDVVFNALFIFPSRHITLAGWEFLVPGFGLGVTGAALGTAASQLVVGAMMLYAVLVKSPSLHLSPSGKWKLTAGVMKTARRISLPMALEQVALCGAQIVSTRIVAPLGTVAIAANSFGITAESLCYMPGYGIQSAATTLVGQSSGAKRPDLAKKFAWLTVLSGMGVMTVCALIMYAACPAVFAFLTPDQEVQKLCVHILRIELWSEPLFGASIIASGALRGIGDTLVPGLMNLVSIWGVRLTLAFFLSARYGLAGAWIGMCVELCFRGLLLLFRLATHSFSDGTA